MYCKILLWEENLSICQTNSNFNTACLCTTVTFNGSFISFSLRHPLQMCPTSIEVHGSGLRVQSKQEVTYSNEALHYIMYFISCTKHVFLFCAVLANTLL